MCDKGYSFQAISSLAGVLPSSFTHPPWARVMKSKILLVICDSFILELLIPDSKQHESAFKNNDSFKNHAIFFVSF